jgi:predicted AAA+ superfamily ATPase
VAKIDMEDAIARVRKNAAKQRSLEEVGQKTEIADIVYHGEKLILPTGMDIPSAVQLLIDRQEYLETTIRVHREYDAFPYDGANALNKVLAAQFGWAQSVSSHGWFGESPPTMLMVNVGPGKTIDVPWGDFSLPGVDGRLTCDVTRSRNRLKFVLSGKIKRKDEATVRMIMDKVEEYLRENSIYRGQALKIRFRDDDGDSISMPIPEFIDTSKIQRSSLIYSDEVMESVETNLFTPIERVGDFVANGLPIKRAVLLEGTYGTGKTLAATVASRLAVDNGITYVYCARADELAEALEFARQYQSPACVVFCEDVDRELDGERDAEMDSLLNIIDGVDTKSSNVIIVLTSNAVENINVAMLRPGRLDAVINITPPDGPAVQRLIRSIGGEAIDPDADLTLAGDALAGQIPAVVSEVVKRAKIAQLRRQAPGTQVRRISESAILEAAKSMASQLKLLGDKVAATKKPPSPLDGVFKELVVEGVRDYYNS